MGLSGGGAATSATTQPVGPAATRRDLAATGLVLGVAATAWFGWAHAAPPSGWSGPLTLGGLVAVLVAIGSGVLVWTHRESDSAMQDPANRRAYGRAVIVEVVAILAGVVVLGATDRSSYLAAWILFVVGVHFVPLARVFAVGALAVAGGALVVVSALATIVAMTTDMAPSALAGGLGGLVMLVCAGRVVWRLARPGRVAVSR